MRLVQVTANGEQHGCINEIGNSVQDDGFSHMAEAVREKAKKLKKEESKVVKARYINLKNPSKRLEKIYCRWAGDPILFFRLIPNEVYEVPLGMVNEVNGTGLRIRGEKEVNGEITKKDGGLEQEYQLVPVSF